MASRRQGSTAARPSAVLVLALAIALSAEEQEVLAYLLSSGGEWPRQREHLPELGYRCFGCYKSFWARWDASPKRKGRHRVEGAGTRPRPPQPEAEDERSRLGGHLDGRGR
ncbi:uncharacterized protein LOC121994555 [Zingiber officinale]|uniref:Uncharacterized protein n=1 Tax=Zingiber officinale TaxID=94328 RepID=A0A8J5L5W2_ZINOF|nr:uncharacterized protein LOC121994555 [Zingiber officinale]KAG6502271.1 hypothetical protein ZIOFF_042160 [Zingiber officinale]